MLIAGLILRGSTFYFRSLFHIIYFSRILSFLINFFWLSFMVIWVKEGQYRPFGLNPCSSTLQPHLCKILCSNLWKVPSLRNFCWAIWDDKFAEWMRSLTSLMPKRLWIEIVIFSHIFLGWCNRHINDGAEINHGTDEGVPEWHQVRDRYHQMSLANLVGGDTWLCCMKISCLWTLWFRFSINFCLCNI